MGSWLKGGYLPLRTKLSVGGESIAYRIFFLSGLLLLLSSPIAVLLNCFYLNRWVLPFPFDSPPHHTGEEWGSNCVVLCCQGRLKHNISLEVLDTKSWGTSLRQFVFGPIYSISLWDPLLFAGKCWVGGPGCPPGASRAVGLVGCIGLNARSHILWFLKICFEIQLNQLS